MLAPRPSKRALVVIVVPWAKNSISDGFFPCAINRFTPSSTPSAGLEGVEETFSTSMDPSAMFKRTRSV